MEACNCVDTQWFTDDLLIKYQYLSDYFIAVAYISITLELLFFVKKAAFFPCRWVLIQFGASIFLCGATHLINLWTLSMHSKIVAVVMTVAKLSTALVSCAAALTLLNFIPQLLKVKKRESILKRRADELNTEMGLILTEEELDQIIFFLRRGFVISCMKDGNDGELKTEEKAQFGGAASGDVGRDDV